MYQLKQNTLKLLPLILTILTGITACDEVTPLREETITLLPMKTASIFGNKQSEKFGVCAPLLDRRGTRLFLWDEFLRTRAIERSAYYNSHLTGYEVAVVRGESCHLRIADTFQAAVWFDLSRLPSTAVVSAELRMSANQFAGLDAPYLFGTREQCAVALIGEATEPWESGIYHRAIEPATGDGPRPFITSIPARIDSGPYERLPASLNVSNTVGQWVRGVRPNNGFVITPDLAAATDFYRHTDEGGYMCPLWLNNFELVVTVAVPDR